MHPAFHLPPPPLPPLLPLRSPPLCTTPPPRARRLSLPTYRERRYLHENYVDRAKGRPDAYIRTTAFALTVWPLIVRNLTPEEALRRARWRRKQQGLDKNETPHSDNDSAGDSAFDMPLPVLDDGVLYTDEEEVRIASTHVDFDIPPWAYVVHVRTAKTALGKRAVQRNRAKRRIRAAASQVFPNHACRGMEYVFSANPESLTIAYPDLVEEVRGALKRGGFWKDEMTLEMLRREQYCQKW